MDDYESLSHTKWECKYHVVFIPKCRRKTLYGELRKHLGEVFRGLAEQKESRIEEGHLMVDHVHMMISSTRFRRWWGLSRGRVRSTWPAFTVNGSGTSWASTLGTRVQGVYRVRFEPSAQGGVEAVAHVQLSSVSGPNRTMTYPRSFDVALRADHAVGPAPTPD